MLVLKALKSTLWLGLSTCVEPMEFSQGRKTGGLDWKFTAHILQLKYIKQAPEKSQLLSTGFFFALSLTANLKYIFASVNTVEVNKSQARLKHSY